MLAADASEIHAYPLRPEGFEEPLFPTAGSKRAIMEHLLTAPWICRASELEECSGEATNVFEEPIELDNSRGYTAFVWSTAPNKRCSRKRWRVVEVLDHWREIRGWWDEERTKDRMIFRVLLSRGMVVDLAQERSEGWFLVGVVD